MENWEAYVRKVVPYVPGEQPQDERMIKLNTNENPYPPAPGVLRALKEFDTDKLRLYPEPTCKVLVDAIAKNYGLDSSQVFVGVGSDDVLAMIFLTFFNSKKPVLFPDITYSFYDVWADMLRIPYEVRALDENFLIKKEDYYGENGGVIFPNPNAPTGILMELSEIEDIIAHNRDVIVVVDEGNFAGMRVGYAMGNQKLIRYINDVKYSFNSYTMNQTALALGVEAIRDRAYFEETRQKIIDTREWTKRELKALGFAFGDSMSNFIFAAHERIPAKELFEALRKEHIYVRYFSKERIENYLRISIGTREEMETFVEFLKNYLQ